MRRDTALRASAVRPVNGSTAGPASPCPAAAARAALTREAGAAGSGVLLAPGSLFSPTQLPSTWMRVAAATCLNDRAMKFLVRALA